MLSYITFILAETDINSERIKNIEKAFGNHNKVFQIFILQK